MPRLRIGIAQIGTTTGDLVGNRQKVLKTTGEAMSLGMDFLAVPELAICGNPPEDLLFRPQFLAENLDKSLSAGLGPDQPHTHALPPYEVLNLLPTAYVEADQRVEQIIAIGINEQEVKITARLVDTSKYQYRQIPVEAKITRRAFGWDRGCLLPINTTGRHKHE